MGNLGKFEEEEKEKVGKTRSVLARSWGEEGGRGATLCLPPSAKKEVPPHPKVGGQEEAVSESCQPHGMGT